MSLLTFANRCAPALRAHSRAALMSTTSIAASPSLVPPFELVLNLADTPTSSVLNWVPVAPLGQPGACMQPLQALNRNARKPKKANHGKRPNSHFNRRKKRLRRS